MDGNTAVTYIAFSTLQKQFPKRARHLYDESEKAAMARLATYARLAGK